MIEMRAEVAVGRAGRPEPGEVDRAAISCRKSEIKLSLPHEQSIPSACRILGPPFRRRFRDDKSARKNLLLKISCNPLISLDSDERIQGNPRKSNPPEQGFPRRNEEAPRKPNLIDAFRQRLLRPVRQSRYRLLAVDPDVVLRVAGGIVRIAGGIIRAAARLSGGIDRLIGVAAGERERRDRKNEAEPLHRPPLLPE